MLVELPEFYTKLMNDVESILPQAREAVKDIPESQGAYNFDSCYVTIPEGIPFHKISEKELGENLTFGAEDDGEIHTRNGLMRIGGHNRLQQEKRTKFVEKVRDLLCEKGYTAEVHYYTD